MRKASLPRKLNEIDERLDKLRKQIKRKADPIAIANTLAAFHFDSMPGSGLMGTSWIRPSTVIFLIPTSCLRNASPARPRFCASCAGYNHCH